MIGSEFSLTTSEAAEKEKQWAAEVLRKEGLPLVGEKKTYERLKPGFWLKLLFWILRIYVVGMSGVVVLQFFIGLKQNP